MEKKISTFFVLYFVTGLIFAFGYAAFYHWPFSGYLSPGFYVVIISWPYQAIGFSKDLMYYGFAGKQI